MNRIPNVENAFIGIEKLTEYCLNENHSYGKEKARLFKSVLGIGTYDAYLLKEALLEGLSFYDCISKEKDQYGERYEVIMKIRIFEKEANVITGWIIRVGEDFPRLTSCYITKKKI